MILLLPETIGSANDVVVTIFNGEKFLRNLRSENVIEKTMPNDYRLDLRTP